MLNGSNYDEAHSVACDKDGNVYMTGYFKGTVDFDPGAGSYFLSSVSSAPPISDIFVSKYDKEGRFIWAKSMGGPSRDIGTSLAVDDSANVYVTGHFILTADFDPGPNTYNLVSDGSEDIFILKLDKEGNLKWAKQIQGYESDYGNAIALDSVANVYVTGTFYKTADFDPGSGSSILNTGIGSNDVYILKLDRNGNFDWAKAFGGWTWDTSNGIAVDKAGNVYNTGYFTDSADFDPGAEAWKVKSVGSEDAYLLKLNSKGDFAWVKTMGGTVDPTDFNDYDNAWGLHLDKKGHLYMTGWFAGPTDFNPGPEEDILERTGGLNTFVTKLDTSGKYYWAKAFYGPYRSIGMSVLADDESNVYVTGRFVQTVDFDPGPGEYKLSSDFDASFICKLDSSGDFRWARNNGNGLGLSLTQDRIGNIYTCGRLEVSCYLAKLGNKMVTDYELPSRPGLGFCLAPNPATNQIRIETDKEQSTYNMRDAFGRIVLSGKVDESKIIDISQLPFGIFFLQIGEEQPQKLVKQ